LYTYNAIDRQLVAERVTQFRDQTTRYLAGELTDEQYRPLRLQNGLYIQRHAPMLRIAVPYGLLSSAQMRKLAQIARSYDKGYVHVSTRQNIQLNWPPLERVPDLIGELADVDMHCIQTSGNCIRNTTTDQFAGVSADEILDPRPYCEIIRQWSTLHPEFAFLPRKFKIAVSASRHDRAAIYAHDVGVQLLQSSDGNVGAKIMVGGGLGRTPVIGQVIEEWLDICHLRTYLEAILRVYNLLGRRDNKYKARIKILVKAMGVDAFRRAVHKEWSTLRDGPGKLEQSEIARYLAHFPPKPYVEPPQDTPTSFVNGHHLFERWVLVNTRAHHQPGYRSVTVCLKSPARAPGDITADQLEHLADLSDRFSFSEARTTHHQNIVLADVRNEDLFELWRELQGADLAAANAQHLTDMICCPGGDFCNLANAKSIPVAQAIQTRFDDLDYVHDLGPIELNISGCMNACGHHHIGHIGILGVDKKGKEFFQISLGGRQAFPARIGTILGPSFNAEDIPVVIERIIDTYVKHREEDEMFIETYERIGIEPFKEAAYA
jgi:sulfite reductase (NADPH) hemoprotein beta-component